ncbi:hypothetical protein L7F22_055188 [Adiantum nelumboides]|nr:hypothetical protein [Adiantum nelumboides]
MGLQMLRKAVLLLLLTSLACTDASRYMSTDDGARHRLWPLPMHRPFHLPMHRPFHSQDDSAIRIWPMPLQVSRGNVSMSVSPHLEISVSVAGLKESESSFVIANAFHRYKHIIFLHGESQFNIHDSTELLLNSELYLKKLIVNVSWDDDTLDFDTDESYHLYIPSDLTLEQAYLQIIERINQITFRLEFPETWKIYNAFHVSLLRPVRGEVPEDMIVDEQPEVEENEEILQP